MRRWLWEMFTLVSLWLLQREAIGCARWRGGAQANTATVNFIWEERRMDKYAMYITLLPGTDHVRDVLA